MAIQQLIESLKSKFGLKDRHILILKALQERELTAPKICKATSIPIGRIYEPLNELLAFGLIEKGNKKPTHYHMHRPEEKVLNYLKYKHDELIAKENDILEGLERIESKQQIDFIDNKKDYSFALISFFSQCRHHHVKGIYQIVRQTSIPMLLYPSDTRKFTALREVIVKNRQTITHAQMSFGLLVKKAYYDLYREGVTFNMIIGKEPLDQHFRLIKKELGNKFLEEIIRSILDKIREGRLRVYVTHEFIPMGSDISEREVLLCLIHKGFITAISIQSPRIADLYLHFFDSMKAKAESFEEYLKKSAFYSGMGLPGIGWKS